MILSENLDKAHRLIKTFNTESRVIVTNALLRSESPLTSIQLQNQTKLTLNDVRNSLTELTKSGVVLRHRFGTSTTYYYPNYDKIMNIKEKVEKFLA